MGRENNVHRFWREETRRKEATSEDVSVEGKIILK
jgi:hypothetical protein